MSFTYFKGNSCPACSGDRKDKDCRRSDRTGYVHCRGRREGDFVPGHEYAGEDSLGFSMWADENARQGRRRSAGPRSAPLPPREQKVFDPATHFSEYTNADRRARPFFSPSESDEFFVKELGLPAWAYECMSWEQYGDSWNRHCWTCREWGLVDGEVVPVGRHFRYPGGDKRTHGNPMLPDEVSKRGVFLPTEWWKEVGPVFLPEGASDALTLRVMGLPAIGRPNNGAGGVPTACHLIHYRGLDERQVVVLIENDQKADGRWPALEGGRKAAALAARLLGRPVWVYAPQEGHKDVRAFFKSYLAAGLSVNQIAEHWLDTATLVEVFEPGQDAPPASPPVPAIGREDACPERDYSDLAAFVPEVALEHASEEWSHRRSDMGGENPCAFPQYVGLQHAQNWNPLELTKRCGRCEGCLQHKLSLNLRTMRVHMAVAIVAGCRLYWRELTPKEWTNWRGRFSDSPAFDGKGYHCVRQEGSGDEPDRLFVLTTVPTLGCPLSPGDSPEEELADALNLAAPMVMVNIRRGRRHPYSSSRNWEKDELPPRVSEYQFKAKLASIDQEFRQRILDDVQAGTTLFPASPSDPSGLHYRLYYKPGGWDSESLERFWSHREGYTVPGGEPIEFYCSHRTASEQPQEPAQAHADDSWWYEGGDPFPDA